MSSTATSVVPPCPQGLSIRREDFLDDQFSVDAFLTRWNVASVSEDDSAYSDRPKTLENLRDDLGIYLKVLRSAMIELINEDYADFVNLSTNLIGLDTSIKKLEEPLMKYRDDVQQVKASLEGTLKNINDKLEHREQIYAKKIALQNLEHITNTLLKIERLLGLGSKENVVMTGDLVERVAAEINHLNFCVSKCDKASGFVKELQPRLKVIGDHLHGSLENQMLSAISKQDIEMLRRCLRIFVTVDRASDAEELVRKKVLRPQLENCISEQSLNEDPRHLDGVFVRVKQVIPSHLKTLLQLTSRLSHTSKTARQDFDFLINSFWPEVLELIDENLSFIFSPGNPDVFFNNYNSCMRFLCDFECELPSPESVLKFRETESYKAFWNRWNLPVYFQIRFQEIALPMETCLSSMFARNESSQDGFRLEASSASLNAVKRCWDDKTFIEALAHRFWKLSLQIIARYARGVKEAPDLEAPIKESAKAVAHEVKASATTVAKPNELNSGKNNVLGHKRSSSDTSHPNAVVEKVTYRSMPEDLINLYVDVTIFIGFLDGHLLENVILPRLGELSIDQISALKIALKDSRDQLDNELPTLASIIVSNVNEKCLPLLKQVSDIPRLYRRTNREVPSKPCTYINSLISAVSNFHMAHASLAPKEVMSHWLESVFRSVTKEYLNHVSEVLAAVQKMEESLRRLKKVRDTRVGSSAGPGSSSSSSGGNTTVSDDDKIRLQLYLDVHFFLDNVNKKFGVSPSKVENANELQNLVTEATANLETVRVRVHID